MATIRATGATRLTAYLGLTTGPMPPTLLRKTRSLAPPAILILAASLAFGGMLQDERPFVDEWAYISQSYFLEKLANPNDPAWLEYPAFDLPPLPKYQIGLALDLAGYRPPGPQAMRAWYRDTSSTFGPPGMLVAARRPSLLWGIVGVLAVYALGSMAFDRRVGTLAGLILVADPLYRMHARRAMSDVPAEALVQCTLAIALLAWGCLLARRIAPGKGLLLYGCAGVPAGLAVLAKLTGGLAMMILAAWAVLGLGLAVFALRARAAIALGTVLAGLVAYGVFVAGNPFLTARPSGPLPDGLRALAEQGFIGRTRVVLRHRAEVSRGAREQFPRDATPTLGARLAATLVQGFGRFGPLGSRRYVPDWDRVDFDSRLRYDWRQDRGVLIWFPLVLCGGALAWRRGRAALASSGPPLAWAILVQSLVAFATIVLFLPLAWDRYFLPLQAPAALLGAVAVVALIDRLARRTPHPVPGALS